MAHLVPRQVQVVREVAVEVPVQTQQIMRVALAQQDREIVVETVLLPPEHLCTEVEEVVQAQVEIIIMCPGLLTVLHIMVAEEME